jgi:hypothetical protein
MDNFKCRKNTSIVREFNCCIYTAGPILLQGWGVIQTYFLFKLAIKGLSEVSRLTLDQCMESHPYVVGSHPEPEFVNN